MTFRKVFRETAIALAAAAGLVLCAPATDRADASPARATRSTATSGPPFHMWMDRKGMCSAGCDPQVYTCPCLASEI